MCGDRVETLGKVTTVAPVAGAIGMVCRVESILIILIVSLLLVVVLLLVLVLVFPLADGCGRVGQEGFSLVVLVRVLVTGLAPGRSGAPRDLSRHERGVKLASE